MKEFLSKTIQDAGAIVMGYYSNASVLRSKEKIVDIVTEADLASDKFITESIKRNYPEHGIVTEESGSYKEEAEFIWCIDPLDGTKNFKSGVPLFGINIALIQSGDIILAGIYLPATRELVIAENGKGSLMLLDGHERKITCSQKQDWAGGYGIGPIRYSRENSALQQILSNLSLNTAWVSAVASPAVSAVWMADGRRDWYTSSGSNSWDFAAPVLIAKEAGCIVSNFEGKNWSPGDRGLIITNNHLYPELAQAVTTAYFS